MNAKRDAIERSVIQALEAQGFSVAQISGKGIPDLLVSKRNVHGAPFVRLVEVKSKGGKATPDQIVFASQRWQGHPIITLRSVDDALRFALLACESGKA